MSYVDSLPPYFQLDKKRIFRADSIQVTLNPGTYQRSDLVTLYLIKQNLGKRPIYFARTTGGIPGRLGLDPYLLGSRESCSTTRSSRATAWST